MPTPLALTGCAAAQSNLFPPVRGFTAREEEAVLETRHRQDIPCSIRNARCPTDSIAVGGAVLVGADKEASDLGAAIKGDVHGEAGETRVRLIWNSGTQEGENLE